MAFDFLTNLVSFTVAVYVVWVGWNVSRHVTGKTKIAIKFIILGVGVLGVLEFLSLVGFQPPIDSILKPLFWDLDIITSIMMLFAIHSLRAKK